jgi:hypothetical protein
MRTSTWKAVALLGLAAVAGGAAGSVVTARVVAGHEEGRHPRGYNWYLDMLTRDLALSATQRDSVRVILQAWDRSMDSVWSRVGPPIDSLRMALRAQIGAQLTPEQQGRYREILARLDAQREAARRQRQEQRERDRNGK